MRTEGLKITYTHGRDVAWEAEWTDDDGMLHSDHGLVGVEREADVQPALEDAVKWVGEKVQ